MKGCILLYPNKDDHRFTRNYCGITLTSIEAKVYNCTGPEIERVVRKNQNSF